MFNSVILSIGAAYFRLLSRVHTKSFNAFVIYVIGKSLDVIFLRNITRKKKYLSNLFLID